MEIAFPLFLTVFPPFRTVFPPMERANERKNICTERLAILPLPRYVAHRPKPPRVYAIDIRKINEIAFSRNDVDNKWAEIKFKEKIEKRFQHCTMVMETERMKLSILLLPASRY